MIKIQILIPNIVSDKLYKLVHVRHNKKIETIKTKQTIITSIPTSTRITLINSPKILSKHPQTKHAKNHNMYPCKLHDVYLHRNSISTLSLISL